MALHRSETNAAMAFMSVTESEYKEGTRYIPVADLHEYYRHPFKIRMNEDMAALVESIKESGVIEPLLIRRDPRKGGFEIISGHRRWTASKLAGLENVPCITRDIDDEYADVMMADSNLKREEIMPSEKAWAYRIKLEAIKKQGKRTDLTSAQIEQKLKGTISVESLASETGESRAKIQRYIRLTYLVPELLEGVDKEDLPLGAGVAISYLSEEQQQWVHAKLVLLKKRLTLTQAEIIKEIAQNNESPLTEDDVHEILMTSAVPVYRRPTPPPAPKQTTPVPVPCPAPTAKPVSLASEHSEVPSDDFVTADTAIPVSPPTIGSPPEISAEDATFKATIAVKRAIRSVEEVMQWQQGETLPDKVKQHLFAAHAELVKYQCEANLPKEGNL